MATPPSIEAFYRDHADAVYAFLVSLTRDRTRAEDLMQDTFIKATRSLAGYRGGSPRSWLFTIARTTFLDHVRRRANAPHAELAEQAATPQADPDVGEQEIIRRVLDRMPERQRSALLMSDHVGMSTAEVAEVFALAPGAARVLIHRARHAFRTIYEQESA